MCLTCSVTCLNSRTSDGSSEELSIPEANAVKAVFILHNMQDAG